MTTLNDDIARIAALRGKPAANYAEQAVRQMRERRGVYSNEIMGLFRVPSVPRRELETYDTLPQRSRSLLMDLPLAASALKYADLLDRVGDEEWLVDTVRGFMPTVLKAWVQDHYGRDHPSVRKYP